MKRLFQQHNLKVFATKPGTFRCFVFVIFFNSRI